MNAEVKLCPMTLRLRSDGVVGFIFGSVIMRTVTLLEVLRECIARKKRIPPTAQEYFAFVFVTYK